MPTSTWARQTIEGTADGQLGTSFARFGADLVIGEPGSAGRILQYGGTPLTLSFVFDNPSPQTPSSAFGTALATFASESAIFAGAPDADVGPAADGGEVYLISPGGVQTASLPVAGGRFGSNLFLMGDRLCIQAPGDGGAGRVHVWDRSLLFSYAPIDDPSPSPGANFGAAMCEYDGVLVIGAPQQEVGGVAGRGSVFLFRLN